MKIAYRLAKSSAKLLFATGVLALSVQGVFAQTNDFFSNTISPPDSRSNGSDGKPGFNPCGAGGVAIATGCSTAGPGALLSVANTGTLFPKLGPGAVTDNMFGIVEQPASPGICGAGSTAVSEVGTNKLNCGDVRFDITTQGQTIPTVGNLLNGAMTTNESLAMISCAAGTTVVACAADPSFHNSQFENGFAWNPTATASTAAVTTSNMPTFGSPAAAPGTISCAGVVGTSQGICSSQGLTETTNLSGTTSTSLKLASNFSGQSVAGNLSGALTVNWQSTITQSEFAGSGGVFTQDIAGSFDYNANTVFPSMQYPRGESFTLQASGAAVPAGTDTIP